MFNSFTGSFKLGRRKPRVNQVVSSGLTLHLDAGDSASYPGSGSTWTDLASPQQNITLFNSPSFTSGTPAYFTFNGTNQYGTGSGNNVVPSTAYTKSVWFYVNAFQDNNLVSSDSGGHFMYMGPDGASQKIYCGHSNWSNYTDFPSTSSFVVNTWYNVVLTFTTADGMVLYVNGAQDATYTANKSQRSGNGSTNIGCFGAGGNLFNGRIAHVMCYDKALSGVEVLQNYNALRTRFGL